MPNDVPQALRFFTPSMKYGGIEDVGLAIRWDAATLRDEVRRRAAVLLQIGKKPRRTTVPDGDYGSAPDAHL